VDKFGNGVEVVIASSSAGVESTPEEMIASHLALRAATLEKMRGVKIQAISVVFKRASGQYVAGDSQPIVRSIDPIWYSAPGLGLQAASECLDEEIRSALAAGPFHVTETRVTQDSDGTRVLWAWMTVTTIAAASSAIDKPLDAVAQSVHSLNANDQARIGLIRLEVDSDAGQPVLWSITDLQLNIGSAWFAQGITHFRGSE
jgi:hypothetical protein